ncbi:phage tail protein [Pseudomonas sp. MYb118]|uniref:phage tail protein n=1 Tax=Pseudomonas sp. MYb118 TaxID=1848720 RepID=UPI0034CFCA74
MRQQMALGSFIFGLSRNFAYSGIVRVSDGGWADINVVMGKPKSMQAGQKAQTLKISGKSMYAVAMERLDELRVLQALRVPLPMVDGIGTHWGLWRINAVTETQSAVIDDGTALVIDWSVDLSEFIHA